MKGFSVGYEKNILFIFSIELKMTETKIICREDIVVRRIFRDEMNKCVSIDYHKYWAHRQIFIQGQNR